jgi:hypothetical protein
MVRSLTLSTDIRDGKSQVMYMGEKWAIIFEKADVSGDTSDIFYDLMHTVDPSLPMITVHSSKLEILPEKYGQEPDIVY